MRGLSLPDGLECFHIVIGDGCAFSPPGKTGTRFYAEERVPVAGYRLAYRKVPDLRNVQWGRDRSGRRGLRRKSHRKTYGAASGSGIHEADDITGAAADTECENRTNVSKTRDRIDGHVGRGITRAYLAGGGFFRG